MARGRPDNKLLEECREVHFPYELRMLAETYQRLKGLGPGACRNVLIESFCVHARNLIEFYRGSGKNDHMKAKYFTREGIYRPEYVGDPDGAIGRTLYAKLSQQVMHMSKGRTSDPAKKIGSKDRETIFEALRKETALFLARMDPPIPRAIRVGGSDASATNAITIASVRLLGDDEEEINA